LHRSVFIKSNYETKRGGWGTARLIECARDSGIAVVGGLDQPSLEPGFATAFDVLSGTEIGKVAVLPHALKFFIQSEAGSFPVKVPSSAYFKNSDRCVIEWERYAAV
jgi:hypothetical protein